VVGNLWNWRRTREEKKDMITDRNPNLSFTAYDSIHGDQNQYPKQIVLFFTKIIQLSYKDHYMAIYSLQHVHYTCNY